MSRLPYFHWLRWSWLPLASAVVWLAPAASAVHIDWVTVTALLAMTGLLGLAYREKRDGLAAASPDVVEES